MASHFGTRCPKCDYSSSNPETCDSCGALISKIKARDRDDEDNDYYTPGVNRAGAGSSFTKIMLIAVAVLAVVAFAVFQMRESGPTTSGTGSVASVFTENFDTEVVNYSATPVLVDFHATWCGPCKTLAPRLEQMASDYSTKLKVVKVDIDRDPEIARRYSVQGVPTLVLVKNGSEVARTVGALPLPQLKSQFDPHL